MVAPFSKMPALPIAIGLIAGILLWSVIAGVWLPVTLLAVGAVLAIKKLHYISFFFYSAAIGWGMAQIHSPGDFQKELLDGERREYTAVVRDISTSPTIQTLTLRIDSVGSEGKMNPCRSFKISATMLPDWSLFIGEKLLISAVIEPLDTYNDFPHDRNMRFYNLKKGIVGQTYLDDGNVVPIGEDKSLSWWFYKRRQAVTHLLASSELSEPAYQLLSAITVGDSDELDGTMRENFRAAGIAHALALSGFHVGIIVLIVSVGLLPLRMYYRLRKARMCVALLLIWFYAAMVGMPDSVVRAVVMVSIILVGKIIGETSTPFNSLCTAVAIILAVSPFSLFSAGFQLSVAAVVGILALSDKLNPFDSKRHRLYRMAMFLTVPISAIAGTMVITASVFHRLPLLFCLSNVLVSVFLPPLMLCGIGVILCTAMGLNAVWLCKVCDGISWIIDKSADSIASFAYSEINSIYLNELQITALAITVAMIMIAVNFPKRKILWLLCPVFVLCLLCAAFFREVTPQSEAFIVRQAANTPIVMRNGRTVYAVFTCHPRIFKNAKMKFERRMSDYFTACGVDSVMIVDSDFDFGPFSRRGDVMDLQGKRIALASKPGRLDSVSGHIDYALVCSRFRGGIADIENYIHPDTIILSRDLSLKRATELKKEAKLPIIDLREQ